MPKLAEQLAAPVLDAAALLAAYWVLPPLAQQLGRTAPANLVILLAAHFLMCAGVAAARYLKPAEVKAEAGVTGQAWLLGLTLPFSLALIAMLIIAGGLLDETTACGALLTQASGSNGSPWLVLGITLGFLMLLSAFPSAVLYSPKARLATGSRAYWAVRLGSLAAVNAMVLVTAAFWQGYLADTESLQAGLGLRVFLTVILYPVFLLFYAAPRLALASLEPGRGQLAGFFIMLAVYVWQLTA